MSLPHMDVPRPPVPTSAIRSFLPVGAEIPVVFAFISDKGLSKAVPAIAPVVARKCLLDIWFVVLCIVNDIKCLKIIYHILVAGGIRLYL